MTKQNQLLSWATGAGANVLEPSAYAASDERQQGFQIGVANPDTANTALRQATFAAAMVGLFTSDRADVDVLDDGDVGGFRENFEAALSAFFLSQVPANIFHFGVDTSTTASALTVPAIYPLSDARPDGFTVAVKVKTSITGTGTTPVTLSIDGDTPKNIVRPDGAHLQAGDLVANQVAVFVFDGTKYFMASPNNASFSGGGGGGGTSSPGTAGADGSRIYSGSSAPAPTLGANGDVYFNTATYDVFQRVSGAWSLLFNCKGADAPRPSAITLNVATTLTTAHFDYEVKLSAAATFTTTLPTPVANGGVGRFHIYNASAVPMTLATPSGSFVGPRGSNAATMTLAAGQTLFVISDGANWVASMVSGDIGVPDVFDYTITAGVSQWLSDDISVYRKVEVLMDGFKASWGGTRYDSTARYINVDFAESSAVNEGGSAEIADIQSRGLTATSDTPGYGGTAFELHRGLFSIDGDAGAQRWRLIGTNEGNTVYTPPYGHVLSTAGTRLRVRTITRSGSWPTYGVLLSGRVRMICWK